LKNIDKLKMPYFRVIKYPVTKPEKNLQIHGAKPLHEDEFTNSFIKVYQKKYLDIHSRSIKKNTLLIRNFPVAGNGIADILGISWPSEMEHDFPLISELGNYSPTIRAFELKISNWKKGLMQAHRYRYFSHASILVVPMNKFKLIRSNIDLFKTLNIGIWFFDPAKEQINNFFTPRPNYSSYKSNIQKAIQQSSQIALAEFRLFPKFS
jgi:hypothetical protein